MATLWLSTVWDIVSNLFLIAFPLTIVMKKRLPLRTKSFAIFRLSSVGIVVVLAIARVATSHATTGLSKVFWLHFWGAIQCGLFLFINNLLAIYSQHRDDQQSRSKRQVQERRYSTSFSTPPQDSLQSRKKKDVEVLTESQVHPALRFPSATRPATQYQPRVIVRTEPTIIDSYCSEESDGAAGLGHVPRYNVA
jgi:hypothetical protein